MATSNLTIRLLTAAVMVPLLLLLLFLGPAWGWLLFLLLVAALGAVELFGMVGPGDRALQACGTLLTLGVALAVWFAPKQPLLALSALLVLPFASIALVLWRLGDLSNGALRLATSTFGPAWIGGGVGAIALLRLLGGEEGPGYVVLALVLAWLADTGGYFAGRAFGKHKLYERVSPKKTVEGAMGGVVGAVAGALIVRLVVLTELPIRDAVALGVVGSLAGMLGDLGESLLKRSVGVKDSGGIVPGHGGMLDRIDAVLITAPLTLLYLLWIR